MKGKIKRWCHLQWDVYLEWPGWRGLERSTSEGQLELSIGAKLKRQGWDIFWTHAEEGYYILGKKLEKGGYAGGWCDRSRDRLRWRQMVKRGAHRRKKKSTQITTEMSTFIQEATGCGCCRWLSATARKFMLNEIKTTDPVMWLMVPLIVTERYFVTIHQSTMLYLFSEAFWSKTW